MLINLSVCPQCIYMLILYKFCFGVVRNKNDMIKNYVSIECTLMNTLMIIDKTLN